MQGLPQESWSLAHPAIIAREHRIPAVVGTGCATTVLRDGQTVTMDGATGMVSFDDQDARQAVEAPQQERETTSA